MNIFKQLKQKHDDLTSDQKFYLAMGLATVAAVSGIAAVLYSPYFLASVVAPMTPLAVVAKLVIV